MTHDRVMWPHYLLIGYNSVLPAAVPTACHAAGIQTASIAAAATIGATNWHLALVPSLSLLHKPCCDQWLGAIAWRPVMTYVAGQSFSLQQQVGPSSNSLLQVARSPVALRASSMHTAWTAAQACAAIPNGHLLAANNRNNNKNNNTCGLQSRIPMK